MRLLVATAALVLGAPTALASGIYRYVEKDGTVVYTNVPPSGASAKKARRLSGSFHAAPSKETPPPKLRERPGGLTAYDDLIVAASTRYRIPASLVRAVMHVESAFNPTAVSPKGACGLMQLMPETAREMYVKDIFDAKENIEGGTRYLRFLANEFDGDMVKMLAAYNAGPHAVRKYNGNVPPYAETQAYVRKVVSLYFQYKAQSQVAEVESSSAEAAGE